MEFIDYPDEFWNAIPADVRSYYTRVKLPGVYKFVWRYNPELREEIEREYMERQQFVEEFKDKTKDWKFYTKDGKEKKYRTKRGFESSYIPRQEWRKNKSKI